MAIALVGQVANFAYTTALVATRTTTSGNTLIATVSHSSRTSVAITDTAGNTWTLAGTSNTASATGAALCSVYYCIGASSVTSVTATEASSTTMYLVVSEWSGITTYRTSAAAFNPAPSTCPVTASNQDLVVATIAYFFSATGRNDTASAGWTRLAEVTNSNTNQAAGVWRVATAAGSQGPSWTGLGTGSAGHVTAAFYGTISNTPPVVTPPLPQRKATGTNAILTMTATDSDGSIASATWANTSRPAGAAAPVLTMSGTPSGITATTDNFSTPGVYTFTPTATDDLGAIVNGGVATVYVYASDKTCKVSAFSHGSSGWSGTASDVSDANDATYATSPLGPVNARTIARMNPIADGDLKLTKLRLRLDPLIVGGAPETCTVEILNGPSDTVIATRTGINVSTTSFVDFAATPIALTGPENTAMTNHSVWAIAITANQ